MVGIVKADRALSGALMLMVFFNVSWNTEKLCSLAQLKVSFSGFKSNMHNDGY